MSVCVGRVYAFLFGRVYIKYRTNNKSARYLGKSIKKHLILLHCVAMDIVLICDIVISEMKISRLVMLTFVKGMKPFILPAIWKIVPLLLLY